MIKRIGDKRRRRRRRRIRREKIIFETILIKYIIQIKNRIILNIICKIIILLLHTNIKYKRLLFQCIKLDWIGIRC
jgi:hypothetical protein